MISLLDIERRWAQAMFCKQTLTQAGKDIKPLRYNIKRKLKKASSEALKFYELSKTTCNNDTIIEAEAYSALIEAEYRFFKMDYNEALKNFTLVSESYIKLSKNKDAIESIAYREKVNSLKSLINNCKYNLKVINKNKIR
jgi:hypothetical protein